MFSAATSLLVPQWFELHPTIVTEVVGSIPTWSSEIVTVALSSVAKQAP